MQGVVDEALRLCEGRGHSVQVGTVACYPVWEHKVAPKAVQQLPVTGVKAGWRGHRQLGTSGRAFAYGTEPFRCCHADRADCCAGRHHPQSARMRTMKQTQ